KNLDCEVLFIPMLICSRGEFFIRKLQVKFPNFKIEPVLRLDDSVFIPKRNPSDLLLDKFSVLAGDVHEKIFGSPELRTGISRFGLQGMCGAVVLFSNTPNNTMTIIHESGRTPSTWKALFPRVSRRHA